MSPAIATTAQPSRPYGRHEQVTAAHLKRAAYLYVRQSTVRQVFENTESTQRQYALRQRAIALGWAAEHIVVIDCDQGHSAAQAADRAGFQRLVADVGTGKAGIVMGLEVSRLARNSADWHRLLEICALTDTLILDEDGVYDPGHFNDRLLLGLKGTMSEAELHVLQARLRGGVLSKARRGELWIVPPVGLVYEAHGQVVLDPDRQVQGALQLLFATFRRTGSACATLREFRTRQLLFPTRLLRGLHKGELVWASLTHCRVLQTLHNPRYAGAFVYGRVRVRRGVDGGYTHAKQAHEDWSVLIPDVHPAYLSWDEYQANQQRLRHNAQANGQERRHGPAREGPALLQGLVICGRCGRRMTVGYRSRDGALAPEYRCLSGRIEHNEPTCQRLPGQRIDAAVGQLVVDMVTPWTLEVALQVHEELQVRRQEADHLRQQQVERARWEADVARQRYMCVDPANRLVADTLEAAWNEKLRALTQAQEHYEAQRQADERVLEPPQKAAIQALADDFPRLWQSPKTPARERKRMLRLLVEDVTLLGGPHLEIHLRFRGGTTTSLQLPAAPTGKRYPATTPALIARIDQLLEEVPETAIAVALNEEGLTSPAGHRLDRAEVQRLRRAHHLHSRFRRLRARGLLTGREMAALLGVSLPTIESWRRHGLLSGQPCDARNKYLYQPPGDSPPVPRRGHPLRDRVRPASSLPSAEGGAV